MENFFDIATPVEIHFFYGRMLNAQEIEETRMYYEEDPDGNFSKLAMLYHFRGDEAKTREYLDKIQDHDWRLEPSILMYEFCPSVEDKPSPA